MKERKSPNEISLLIILKPPTPITKTEAKPSNRVAELYIREVATNEDFILLKIDITPFSNTILSYFSALKPFTILIPPMVSFNLPETSASNLLRSLNMGRIFLKA